MLTALLVLPLAGAAAITFLPPRYGSTIKLVAAFFTALTLGLSLVVFGAFDPSNPQLQFVERVNWIPAIGVTYHLGVDGLSLPLVVLTTLLTFLAVLASWRIDRRPKEYFFLLLALETGILGVFLSLDLVMFFLFWEVELIPMYLLIGIWGGARRQYAALKFVIYTLTGSAFMLLGFLLLYLNSTERTFDMTLLMRQGFAPPIQILAFLMIFVAFAIKLPMFPFHTWLPDAHVEAPTAVSVLLAGVLLKMGGYGIFRILFGLTPDGVKWAASAIAILAAVNVIYGAGLCLVQTDLKKLIAYSSISHMGFVLLGVAALTPTAIHGAILQMFSHGIITGLLFLLVGVVYDKAHTREIDSFGGLAARMPVVAILFTAASMAAVGLPGMIGFVAEFTTFVGAYPTRPFATAVACVGVVLGAFYMLWMLQRVFFGPLEPKWAHLSDARGLELVPLVTLTALIVLTGVFPGIVTDLIELSVGPIVTQLRL